MSAVKGFKINPEIVEAFKKQVRFKIGSDFGLAIMWLSFLCFYELHAAPWWANLIAVLFAGFCMWKGFNGYANEKSLIMDKLVWDILSNPDKYSEALMTEEDAEQALAEIKQLEQNELDKAA